MWTIEDIVLDVWQAEAPCALCLWRRFVMFIWSQDAILLTCTEQSWENVTILGMQHKYITHTQLKLVPYQKVRKDMLGCLKYMSEKDCGACLR